MRQEQQQLVLVVQQLVLQGVVSQEQRVQQQLGQKVQVRQRHQQ
jgi:hypothetical protein